MYPPYDDTTSGVLDGLSVPKVPEMTHMRQPIIDILLQ